MRKRKVLIMGAAGRDFHNFNLVYRNNRQYQVVAFTATQIPDIEGRKYPPKLAGKLYPKGIPIWSEQKLTELIERYKIDEVVFSYSDVSYEYVMHKVSLIQSAGADFRILGGKNTMLKSKLPVIAVCATRTGSGKSQTTRKVCEILKKMGKKTAVIRHPMPYGNLAQQVCQKFTRLSDLDKYKCTIEEREEYEPHIERGNIVYAGVDYGVILNQAEKEAQILVWDGGNNDLPFYYPDLHITVVDPLRAGDEISYFPGETNLISADVLVINKVDSASPESIKEVSQNIKKVNPHGIIIKAASPISMDKPELVKGKKVLVIEDGPTLTHGEMSYGAGIVAAKRYGAEKVVDPKPYAVGSLKEVYSKYSHMGALLPAMGYSKKQIGELQRVINSVECDSVIIATPIDLGRILKINKPSVRVGYELQEIGKPDLTEVLSKFVKK
ncbi:MAG: cyclic 2,3-diphosphoglycerate synthase [candidate division Zixibacteria bacterium]|nr:cyclic 2,3-diphosphoglycerate synthase [candidate division Zixibacteria bacterium]